MERWIGLFAFLFFQTGSANAQSGFTVRSIHAIDSTLIACNHGALGDVDADGVPDAIVSAAIPFFPPFAQVRMDAQAQTQGRQFGPRHLADPLGAIKEMLSFDIDKDRLNDLVAFSASGRILQYPNQGPEATRQNGQPFGIPIEIADLRVLFGSNASGAAFLGSMGTADLDADGNMDFFYSGTYQVIFSPARSTGLVVFLNSGQGQGAIRFPNPGAQPTFFPSATEAGYFGLQRPLVVMTTTSSNASGYNSHIEFIDPLGFNTTRSILGIGIPQGLGLGDLDSDGIEDVVISGVDLSGQNAFVAAFQGLRGGGINSQFTLPAAPPQAVARAEAPSLVVVDFNHDSRTDIIVIRTYGDNAPADLLFYENMGGATFQISQPYVLPGSFGYLISGGNSWIGTTPYLPHLLRTADLDGDQEPDLFITSLKNGSNGSMLSYVLLNGWIPYGRRSTLGTASPPGGALGGFEPRIGTAGGEPVSGNQDFSITLTDAPPNQFGALLIGSQFQSLSAGPFSTEMVPRFVSRGGFTNGTLPGGGFLYEPMSVPSDLNLVGTRIGFQWFITDSANTVNPWGIALTRTLDVIVGPR